MIHSGSPASTEHSATLSPTHANTHPNTTAPNNSASARNKPFSKKWSLIKKIVTIIFFIVVITLLFTLIKNIDWQDVLKSLREYDIKTLLMAAGIAFTSYFVFAGYDLIGRKYTGHSLPARQIFPLAFVCYAFTLNLTAWVGGIALRFRLYSRLGLDAATITKIMSLSLLTNWLGYIILAGILFSFRQVDLPEKFKIGVTALQFIGFFLLLVATLYFLACRFSKRRSFHFRSHEITLPNVQIAFSQAALAITNWMLMGLLIFTLMPDKVSYQTILGILLISSIAGVIAHIPAGLGVMETIFVTMLNHQLSQGAVLAAIIGYRLTYFLLPLAIACIVYLTLEIRAKKMAQKNARAIKT